MKETIVIIILCTQTGCITLPDRDRKAEQRQPIITYAKAKPSCMNLYVTSYNSAIIKPCSEER